MTDKFNKINVAENLCK